MLGKFTIVMHKQLFGSNRQCSFHQSCHENIKSKADVCVCVCVCVCLCVDAWITQLKRFGYEEQCSNQNLVLGKVPLLIHIFIKFWKLQHSVYEVGINNSE